MTRNKSTRRAGVSIAYVAVVLMAMVATASLAIDFARVQLAKTQMHVAVDAAARAAVIGAQTSLSQARTDAKAVALANMVDGVGLTLTNSDIQVGRWSSGTFTNGSTPYNAVKIAGVKTTARGTAVSLLFASALGKSQCNISANATSYIVAAINANCTIQADSNPWLAGMPNGTTANAGNPNNNPDSAPNQSPPTMSGITLTSGMVLTFTGISGTGSNDPNGATTGPDGDSGWIGQNYLGAEHSMSNLKAPMNSLIGVFLNNSAPSGSAPSTLDFTSAASRDFTSLSPALRQPFFIGDGKTSGNVPQMFVVPNGATRLFLCSMDEWEWNNNVGSRTVQIQKPQIVSLVE